MTIYEAQPRIGGLWPTRPDDAAGLMHPQMIANQSRHTVQFSDLAWDDNIPHLPKAWQVGQYLERYFERYVSSADVRLGWKVVRTELQDSGAWKVETTSDRGSETRMFDFLLVTTGFFGRPLWPDSVPNEGEAEVPIIHSSKYRDLKGLLQNQSRRAQNRRGGTILIVGGQMSGIEIAGTIAVHLSSAVNSPGEKQIEEPDKYSICHVAHRPSWIFPLFTSPKVMTTC